MPRSAKLSMSDHYHTGINASMSPLHNMFLHLANPRESDKIAKKNQELDMLHDKIADLKADYDAHKKLSPESHGLQKDELAQSRACSMFHHSGLCIGKEAEGARSLHAQSGECVGGPRAISTQMRHVC